MNFSTKTLVKEILLASVAETHVLYPATSSRKFTGVT